MAETVHQEPTTPAAEGQQNNERTFTQAEMNAIISDRLSRERSKYADYDDLKAKAQQFDAAQEAGKTELQKANEKAAKLQAQLDSMTKANTLRDLRGKVAAATLPRRSRRVFALVMLSSCACSFAAFSFAFCSSVLPASCAASNCWALAFRSS